MNAIKPEWNQLHSTWTGALQAGAAHYFTGKPCKYGHIAPRQTLSSQCMKCASENAKLAYRKKVAAYRIARAAKQ